MTVTHQAEVYFQELQVVLVDLVRPSLLEFQGRVCNVFHPFREVRMGLAFRILLLFLLHQGILLALEGLDGPGSLKCSVIIVRVFWLRGYLK